MYSLAAIFKVFSTHFVNTNLKNLHFKQSRRNMISSAFDISKSISLFKGILRVLILPCIHCRGLYQPIQLRLEYKDKISHRTRFFKLHWMDNDTQLPNQSTSSFTVPFEVLFVWDVKFHQFIIETGKYTFHFSPFNILFLSCVVDVLTKDSKVFLSPLVSVQQFLQWGFSHYFGFNMFYNGSYFRKPTCDFK